MSYDSRLYGQWMIDPPLTHNKVRAIDTTGWSCLYLQCERTEREMDGGTLTTLQGVLIEPLQVGISDGWYQLADELTQVVKAVGAAHRLDGAIIRVGEDAGDFERFVVRNGVVVSEFAQMSWPDGTKVELP